jgi:hypothetical protein
MSVGVHITTLASSEMKQESRRNYTAETLCEEVDLKFSKFRKKKENINFLSNIFQSGVINVTLCSLLIRRKQISVIYHKYCIDYSMFSNMLQLFKCPAGAQQQRAFKLTPAT